MQFVFMLNLPSNIGNLKDGDGNTVTLCHIISTWCEASKPMSIQIKVKKNKNDRAVQSFYLCSCGVVQTFSQLTFINTTPRVTALETAALCREEFLRQPLRLLLILLLGRSAIVVEDALHVVKSGPVIRGAIPAGHHDVVQFGGTVVRAGHPVAALHWGHHLRFCHAWTKYTGKEEGAGQMQFDW